MIDGVSIPVADAEVAEDGWRCWRSFEVIMMMSVNRDGIAMRCCLSKLRFGAFSCAICRRLVYGVDELAFHVDKLLEMNPLSFIVAWTVVCRDELTS